MPINVASRLVAKVSRLYAEAAPEDQFALRVWVRDIIPGRKVGSANTVRARRSEKRMVEACARRDGEAAPRKNHQHRQHVCPLRLRTGSFL